MIKFALFRNWTKSAFISLKAGGLEPIRGTSSFSRPCGAIPLQHAKIVAFGSTRKANQSADADANLQALLVAGTKILTIFGKSWTLHVTDALGTSLDANLELIRDSIAYLRAHEKRVFYDAEHFFDGFKPIRTMRWTRCKRPPKAEPNGLFSVTPTVAPCRGKFNPSGSKSERYVGPARYSRA